MICQAMHSVRLNCQGLKCQRLTPSGFKGKGIIRAKCSIFPFYDCIHNMMLAMNNKNFSDICMYIFIYIYMILYVCVPDKYFSIKYRIEIIIVRNMLC